MQRFFAPLQQYWGIQHRRTALSNAPNCRRGFGNAAVGNQSINSMIPRRTGTSGGGNRAGQRVVSPSCCRTTAAVVNIARVCWWLVVKSERAHRNCDDNTAQRGSREFPASTRDDAGASLVSRAFCWFAAPFRASRWWWQIQPPSSVCRRAVLVRSMDAPLHSCGERRAVLVPA
jgi:hypothetical protein